MQEGHGGGREGQGRGGRGRAWQGGHRKGKEGKERSGKVMEGGPCSTTNLIPHLGSSAPPYRGPQGSLSPPSSWPARDGGGEGRRRPPLRPGAAPPSSPPVRPRAPPRCPGAARRWVVAGGGAAPLPLASPPAMRSVGDSDAAATAWRSPTHGPARRRRLGDAEDVDVSTT